MSGTYMYGGWPALAACAKVKVGHVKSYGTYIVSFISTSSALHGRYRS